MGNRAIPPKIIKVIWAKSGGRCAICKTEIIMKGKENNPYPIGEVAHIEGLNPNSPRYNPYMKDRNSYDNLILLCPTCHTKIDRNPDYYTVEKLKQIKYDHESWVDEQLMTATLNTTFAELEVIMEYLISAPIDYLQDELTVIPPKEKIHKNELSKEVEKYIIMGMIGIKQVEEYLNKNPDHGFANRLKHGFVQKYYELKEQGLTGDNLFYELWNFASVNSNDFKKRAAGLNVLTYFFEICEVFEK